MPPYLLHCQENRNLQTKNKYLARLTHQVWENLVEMELAHHQGVVDLIHVPLQKPQMYLDKLSTCNTYNHDQTLGAVD